MPSASACYAVVNNDSVCVLTVQYMTPLNNVPSDYISINNDDMTTIVGYSHDQGLWIPPPAPVIED